MLSRGNMKGRRRENMYTKKTKKRRKMENQIMEL